MLVSKPTTIVLPIPDLVLVSLVIPRILNTDVSSPTSPTCPSLPTKFRADWSGGGLESIHWAESTST